MGSVYLNLCLSSIRINTAIFLYIQQAINHQSSKEPIILFSLSDTLLEISFNIWNIQISDSSSLILSRHFLIQLFDDWLKETLTDPVPNNIQSSQIVFWCQCLMSVFICQYLVINARHICPCSNSKRTSTLTNKLPGSRQIQTRFATKSLFYIKKEKLPPRDADGCYLIINYSFYFVDCKVYRLFWIVFVYKLRTRMLACQKIKPNVSFLNLMCGNTLALMTESPS